MCTCLNRRHFIETTVVSSMCLPTLLNTASAVAPQVYSSLTEPKSKTRVGRVYCGNSTPGWPMAHFDVEGDVKMYEAEFAKLEKPLKDIEFVDAGLVSSVDQLTPSLEKFKDVDGILVILVSMGAGAMLQKLLELKKPIVMFTLPYAGHEWHTIASMQKRGDKIEVLPSSDFADLAVAVRPFRAIHRMNEAKILYLMGSEPDANYVKAVKDKFGTEIVNLNFEQLAQAYKNADEKLVQEDCERWIKEASKIVEPTREEIYKSSRMYYGLFDLLREYKADCITINCLGMGLIQKDMGYPCLGFTRLDSMGLGGVCEADLKSSMTHLIFQYLTGKPGFVTDPVFDLSNSTIIHAHCVSPLNMDGPEGEQCAYDIRSHLEDGLGVSLEVKMRIGQPISLARLIGTDHMLFSTGEIVDTPSVDRGCRTKITTKVKNAQHMLENYSCGLHRVVFYGDHTTDLRRFCRFKDIRIVMEEQEDVKQVPGLEWEPYVHA